MKTSKIIFSLLLLSVALVPVVASAQPTASITDLPDLTAKVGTLLWQIVGLVALVMFVIAGITFMTAGGDPTKVGTARQFVLWGVVGIVVAILAYSIVAVSDTLLS